jgi:four helix bundle protein
MGNTNGRREIAATGIPVSSFRDLRVWQASMDLVEHVYRATRAFPNHEMYGLTQQVQRAVVSVPSNIAEGQAREHLREYLHHLSMAQGSLAELETQLEIARRLGYIPPDQSDLLLGQLTAVARQLRSLRNALERRLPIPARSASPNTQHP